MRQAHRQNTVGPWAKRKLDALERYLAAYHKVMQKQRFKLIYIDAFAGAGWSRVRTAPAEALGLDLPIDDDQAEAEEEFIAGSPVRALATGRGFDHYFFFDADPRRAALLEQLKRDHPQKDIRIKTGDANAGVQKLAAHFHKRRMARGVAFLDPYGPHLHWATVQALAETRKVDVIINFPLAMAINRLIRRDNRIPETWTRLLDDCFGTHEWHDLAYRADQDLFGGANIRKDDATAARLLELYHGRLRRAFGHVVTPSLIENTRGTPLYYLLWASSNGRGAPIAEHIMNLGSRVQIAGRRD
jgi:three-Cys-motif partner protein